MLNSAPALHRATSFGIKVEEPATPWDVFAQQMGMANRLTYHNNLMLTCYACSCNAEPEAGMKPEII
jgi:hypothetical protein